MRSIRNAVPTIAVLALLFAVTVFAPRFSDSLHSPASVQAQGNQGIVSINPNARLPVMTFTATAQTVARPIGGFSTATVEIFGVATAATLQIKCSNDGGVNYYGIPSTTGTVATGALQYVAPAAFSYTGTPEIFWVNLAGCTNVEVVSSGTFTGASASVQITASSNKGII